ncbi:hypothetical protein OIU34_35080 [Pararhizobium sp. BT-229]|uniref:hypothetical protein n=1 Tax=Pararhizobium sp. BT-229 TaxID=2986923 RepID=UPI0021F6BEA3|nr:hypothetical protein [Pararhizobium sp. BT-229]MCV9967057.1 hypothetical protein [Pararhizobium sp. BT-229]
MTVPMHGPLPHDAEISERSLPGFDPQRMIRLVKKAVSDCELDLSGYTVMTEAASGAYVVTPIAAALAGAKEVIAVTRTTRYGHASDIERHTLTLAAMAGVPPGTISVVQSKDRRLLASADIVTNSGHVRPLDAETIGCLKQSAVVPLMFEAWEIQAGRFDVDLAALQARGIATAGTNERHPNIDVFSYLGLMAVKSLLDAGIPPFKTRVAVLCDNPFSDYLRRGLEGAGAIVSSGPDFEFLRDGSQPDVLLVAQRPCWKPVVSADDALWLSRHAPHTVIMQFWGDLDRSMLDTLGLRYWPEIAPPSGHMAVLPSAVGPEPIIRLQVGGLKVGQVLLKPREQRTAADMEYIDAL